MVRSIISTGWSKTDAGLQLEPADPLCSTRVSNNASQKTTGWHELKAGLCQEAEKRWLHQCMQEHYYCWGRRSALRTVEDETVWKVTKSGIKQEEDHDVSTTKEPNKMCMRELSWCFHLVLLKLVCDLILLHVHARTVCNRKVWWPQGAIYWRK